MGELRLSYPACMLVEKSTINPEDIQLLVHRVFAGGLKRHDDVATLLAIEHSRSLKCREWDGFFVETLTRHMVEQLEPVRAMNADKVELIRRSFSRGGVIGSRNEFEIVVRVVERTGAAAAELAAFALNQIHLAIVEGEGPLANRRKGLWAALDMEHLHYINRLMKALGNPDPFSITDAEMLFDPAQNLLNDREATAWSELVATMTRDERAAA